MDKEIQLIEKYLGSIECCEHIDMILEEFEQEINEITKDTILDTGKTLATTAAHIGLPAVGAGLGTMGAVLLAIRTIDGALRKSVRKCGIIRIGKTKEICMAKVRENAYRKKLMQYKKGLSKCKTSECKDEWSEKIDNVIEDIKYQQQKLKDLQGEAGTEKFKKGIKNATDKKTIRI